ncbi:MAG TPA: SusD/RagB family nutrient-binding outer membrane lipoprotein, partial [Bacteroidales bacterium]
MKNIIKYGLFFPLLLLMLTSCDKSFNDIANENPNQATSVPSSLLFNGIENDIYVAPFGDEEKWCQYFLINYDYYGNNRYDFGSGKDYYATLKNVIKMVEETRGTNLGVVNPYEAIGKFFKAYFFTLMSLEMGDIPMSQALKGL